MDQDRYEEDRIAALNERRREEADSDSPDKRRLEVRFGPGSFGCHEAIHVTNLIVDLIHEQLEKHSAVLLDPYWYFTVREAQALLYNAYNSAGGAHLSAPMPTEDRPQLYLVPKE